MPSQITHLAIAKQFMAKHPHQIKDVQRFLDGTVLPDLAADKAVSHYGLRTEKYDILKRNREKVSPTNFLRTHDLVDDLEKGQFLHLYVDDQYYNVFLLAYFRTATFKQSSTDMYETTRRDDAYLSQKYGVTYHDTTYAAALQELNDIWDAENMRKRQQPGYHFQMPYDLAALDEFVESMASISIYSQPGDKK